MQGHEALAVLAQVVDSTRGLPREVDVMREALAAVGRDQTELARYRATFGDELERREQERADAAEVEADRARNAGDEVPS
jgi:hypothetical protein